MFTYWTLVLVFWPIWILMNHMISKFEKDRSVSSCHLDMHLYMYASRILVQAWDTVCSSKLYTSLPVCVSTCILDCIYMLSGCSFQICMYKHQETGCNYSVGSSCMYICAQSIRYVWIGIGVKTLVHIVKCGKRLGYSWKYTQLWHMKANGNNENGSYIHTGGTGWVHKIFHSKFMSHINRNEVNICMTLLGLYLVQI